MEASTDVLAIDTAWLQHFVSYGRFRYDVEVDDLRWLHFAAIDGDLARVRQCLAAGARVTALNANGPSALTHAMYNLTAEMAHYVSCIHPEIVRVLTTTLGRMPTQLEIYGVATHKKTRRFRFHLKKRVGEIVAKFMEAVRRGGLATVRRMVESDEVSVDAVDISTGETALSAAIGSRQMHVAVYLLQKGADTYSGCWVDGVRVSTLHASVRTGDVDLVRQVAAHGGVYAARSYSSQCRLVDAVKAGSYEMIETLLDLGLSMGIQGLELPWPIQTVFYSIHGPSRRHKNLQLLSCAAYWLQNKPLFDRLQRSHTELQHSEENISHMATLLALAVYRKDEVFVLELLEKGADVNYLLGSSITSMVAAVGADSTRMLGLLLTRGGNVSIISRTATANQYREASLLAIAVRARALDCVRVLLPLEPRLMYREQALQEAAKRGLVEIVQLMLENDAIPTSESELQCCLQYTKCPLVVDLLLTQWCPHKYPISALKETFAQLCSSNSSPDLLAVYVAHGLDIVDDAATGINTTSPLIEGVIRGANELPALPVVKFLLENGVPRVTVREGKTPEQDMDAEVCRPGYPNFKRRLFRGCRDLFACS